MVGKPTEKATLYINGQKFEDWETVMVRHAKKENPPFHCRFTCSEGVPIAKNWGVLQIKPGDVCETYLAGILAFTGKVETRQVYFDANRHHIEIQCATHVDITAAAVVHKTMEWKDKTFKEIGSELLNRLGINMVFEGGAPPSYKFPRASAVPGESVYDFLDTLARGLSQSGHGIAFTSNANGDFVVLMGPGEGSDSVVEGVNILVGREIIYNPTMAGSAPVIGERPGNDKEWGANVSHVPFLSEMQELPLPGMKSGMPVTLPEVPAWDQKLLAGRVQSETRWKAEDQITVIATVYGWLRPTGGLWQRNQTVYVTSPMLIMENEKLTAKSVTFTQDDRAGTRTTLELCNDAALGGQAPPIR